MSTSGTGQKNVFLDAGMMQLGLRPAAQAASLRQTARPDSLQGALASLLSHPRHVHDLRSFQAVREALELLREELIGGQDLPQPDLRTIKHLLSGIARPPEVESRPLPAPEPTPLPDPLALSAFVLDLALGTRSEN